MKKNTNNLLPKLKPSTDYKKKYHYRLGDTTRKRRLAINEGIRSESKRTKKNMKQSAISKKGRLNILRIYRRNNNYRDCNTITKDMEYIDNKYKLGKTKNICSKKGGGKKTKKQFLFNPNNPKKSFDVYIDKNPNDTINIKYTTVKDVRETIEKLERLYKSKKYSHKRIWQVGMIMKVRLEVIYKKRNTHYKKVKNITSRFRLAEKYFKFLSKRSKMDGFEKRKNMIFKF